MRHQPALNRCRAQPAAAEVQTPAACASAEGVLQPTNAASWTFPRLVRVFARAGWNEGHNESFAYIEVNNSAQAGGDPGGGLESIAGSARSRRRLKRAVGTARRVPGAGWPGVSA